MNLAALALTRATPRHDPDDFRREMASAGDAIGQAVDLLRGPVQEGMTPIEHATDVNVYLSWGSGELDDASTATGGLGHVVGANLREARRAADQVSDAWNALVEPNVDAQTLEQASAKLAPLAQRALDRINDALAALD